MSPNNFHIDLFTEYGNSTNDTYSFCGKYKNKESDYFNEIFSNVKFFIR